MRVLVTGGGGFLGRELANQLLEEGAEVVVLGRRHYPDLDPALIQVQADIRDPQALAAACAGCCAVFHAAAVPGIWGRPSVFHAINVMGTENVIRACVENRVPNLIFTSSPSVVFSGGDMKNADETSPYPHRYLSEYARTKAEAEQRVLAANGQEGLSTVAIRPHLIWGVGDPHLVPRVLEKGLPEGVSLNINIPPVPREEIKGVAITRQGKSRVLETFDKRVDPRNNTYYWMAGEMRFEEVDPETDCEMVGSRHISITPIHYDLTRYDAIPLLKDWNIEF